MDVRRCKRAITPLIRKLVVSKVNAQRILGRVADRPVVTIAADSGILSRRRKFVASG